MVKAYRVVRLGNERSGTGSDCDCRGIRTKVVVCPGAALRAKSRKISKPAPRKINPKVIALRDDLPRAPTRSNASLMSISSQIFQPTPGAFLSPG
jgi:hypothetical protein